MTPDKWQGINLGAGGTVEICPGCYATADFSTGLLGDIEPGAEIPETIDLDIASMVPVDCAICNRSSKEDLPESIWII
jgi:hypothetical protein